VEQHAGLLAADAPAASLSRRSSPSSDRGVLRLRITPARASLAFAASP